MAHRRTTRRRQERSGSVSSRESYAACVLPAPVRGCAVPRVPEPPPPNVGPAGRSSVPDIPRTTQPDFSRRISLPFSQFGLHSDLLRGVREMGFTRPTPIQNDAIPPAMAGRDVLAAAATGSGKTAAFLLPILHRLIGSRRGTTRALILTPTRELAAQIDEHLRDLAVHTPISGAAIYGGVGMGPQEHAFRQGTDVLIATPGRLVDHLR